MKKFLIATAAIAALAATSAQAQDASWTINGEVVAQCGVTSSANTVNIGDDLVDSDGFMVASAVQASLLAGFNALTTEAWCSGSNNGANLRRTALVRTDDGSALNDFAEAILFDIGIDIPDTFNPSEPSYDEGSSDGGGTATLVTRFGPTGNGSLVEFVADSYPGGLTSPVLVDRPAAGSNGSTTSFTQLANQATRLASGDYTGEVVLTLTPGV